MSKRETTISMPRGEWPLAGSVKPYRRHAFACTGVAEWPARLEEAEGLLGAMARDVRELPMELGEPPKLTATDERSTGPGIDLLVFPEALRYRVADESGWRAVLREHLVGGAPAPVENRSLPGRHVFVCIHAARDERCGRCGPPLLSAVREAVAEAGLEDVTVRATLMGQALDTSRHFILEIVAEDGEFLSVPNEAILESGGRQIVYVHRAGGSYSPQEIKVGVRGELYTQVLEGLKAGQQVVTIGSFFIDAEHKLKGS